MDVEVVRPWWEPMLESKLAIRDLTLLSYASHSWRKTYDWARNEAWREQHHYYVYLTWAGWVASPRPKDQCPWPASGELGNTRR